MRTIIIFSLSFFLCHCESVNKYSSTNAIGTFEKATSKGFWKDLKYNSYHNLYFTSQPKPEHLEEAKKISNIHLVISLRNPAEMNAFNERKYVESLQMKFLNIPIDKNKKLDYISFELVERAIQQHKKNGPILIHDSDGNRAGSWLAGHIYKVHKNQDIDSVLATSYEYGLTDSVWKNKTREFLLKLKEDKRTNL